MTETGPGNGAPTSETGGEGVFASLLALEQARQAAVAEANATARAGVAALGEADPARARTIQVASRMLPSVMAELAANTGQPESGHEYDLKVDAPVGEDIGTIAEAMSILAGGVQRPLASTYNERSFMVLPGADPADVARQVNEAMQPPQTVPGQQA